MKKTLTLFIITFISIFIVFTTLVNAGGKPFEALQIQIDELREQLNSIQVSSGLEVHDGSGLFLGYLVQKNDYNRYIVFNPEVEAFFKVYARTSDPQSEPYVLLQLYYLSDDCTGQAYVPQYTNELVKFGYDGDNLYIIDKTKPTIPLSEIKSYNTQSYPNPDTTCYSYNFSSETSMFPLQQVDFPIADMVLQYPIIIKTAE